MKHEPKSYVSVDEMLKAQNVSFKVRGRLKLLRLYDDFDVDTESSQDIFCFWIGIAGFLAAQIFLGVFVIIAFSS